MFMTIREYRCDPSAISEIAHNVDEHFADQLAEMSGFVAYECIHCGSGELITTTIFSDRASAEQSSEMAANFIRERLSGIEMTRTAMHTGEVLVNRAMREVTEPVHA